MDNSDKVEILEFNYNKYKFDNKSYKKFITNSKIYNLYKEYTLECSSLLNEINRLNIELDDIENDLYRYGDSINNIKYENELIELYNSLEKKKKDALKRQKEFDDFFNKFEKIDECDDLKTKNKLIDKLKLNKKYELFKKDINKASKVNNNLIDSLNEKIKDLKENFDFNYKDINKVNKDTYLKLEKEYRNIINKKKRREEKLFKSNRQLQGLIDELNSILKNNGYNDIDCYEDYLNNLGIEDVNNI